MFTFDHYTVSCQARHQSSADSGRWDKQCSLPMGHKGSHDYGRKPRAILGETTYGDDDA